MLLQAYLIMFSLLQIPLCQWFVWPAHSPQAYHKIPFIHAFHSGLTFKLLEGLERGDLASLYGGGEKTSTSICFHLAPKFTKLQRKNLSIAGFVLHSGKIHRLQTGSCLKHAETWSLPTKCFPIQPAAHLHWSSVLAAKLLLKSEPAHVRLDMRVDSNSPGKVHVKGVQSIRIWIQMTVATLEQLQQNGWVLLIRTDESMHGCFPIQSVVYWIFRGQLEDVWEAISQLNPVKACKKAIETRHPRLEWAAFDGGLWTKNTTWGIINVAKKKRTRRAHPESVMVRVTEKNRGQYCPLLLPFFYNCI